MAAQSTQSTTTTPGGEIPATGPYTQQKPWGFIIVAAGLVAATAIFVVAVVMLKDGDDPAGDIVQVTAPAFALIAGLVGGYFGVRAGTLAAASSASTAGTATAAAVREATTSAASTGAGGGAPAAPGRTPPTTPG